MNLIICRADEVLTKLQENPGVAAVLSIEHPGAVAEGKGAAPRLEKTPQDILVFWDAEEPVYQGPDAAQIRRGIEFVMDHVAKGDVIIHCHAGKARSAAVALGVLALIYPDEKADVLVEKLLEIRPIAAPNIIVVEMVDQLTGRDGALVKAVLENPVIAAGRAKAAASRAFWQKRNPDLYNKINPEKKLPPSTPPAP